jgi:hypothetical protein
MRALRLLCVHINYKLTCSFAFLCGFSLAARTPQEAAIWANNYRTCNFVNSSVDATYDRRIVQQSVVREAAMQQLRSFVDSFNLNQQHLLIAFEYPIFVTAQFTIDLIGSSTKFKVNEQSVFLQALNQTLAPALAANSPNSIELLMPDVFGQVVMSNQQNSTAGTRVLQSLSGAQSLSGVQYNKVTTYVKAVCGTAACTDSQFQKVLANLDGNGTYSPQLLAAIQLLAKNSATSSFNSMTGVEIAHEPRVADLPPASVYQPMSFTLSHIPSWLWVIVGADLAMLVGAFLWVVLMNKRRDKQERAELKETHNLGPELHPSEY